MSGCSPARWRATGRCSRPAARSRPPGESSTMYSRTTTRRCLTPQGPGDRRPQTRSRRIGAAGANRSTTRKQGAPHQAPPQLRRSHDNGYAHANRHGGTRSHGGRPHQAAHEGRPHSRRQRRQRRRGRRTRERGRHSRPRACRLRRSARRAPHRVGHGSRGRDHGPCDRGIGRRALPRRHHHRRRQHLLPRRFEATRASSPRQASTWSTSAPLAGSGASSADSVS